MRIIITVKTKFGEFSSIPTDINQDEFETLIKISNKFNQTGYEMETTDGYVIIPQEIMKESIIIIKKNETD